MKLNLQKCAIGSGKGRLAFLRSVDAPSAGREAFRHQRSMHWVQRVLTGRMLLNVLVVLCVMVGTAYGQETTTITGTVSDEAGPIPGVSVIIKGTSQGTVTNADGQFSLEAEMGQTLVFSFLGYKSVERVIENDAPISLTLEESYSTLDEVVVVGYGTQKKETLTGAVSAVTHDEIVTTKNENVANMLTGKIAGLRVVQNSSEPGQFNTSLDIRGFGAPLVVIDGVPRDNMARLDPQDIESISVIKDASAAVYGSRAANGVIIITTKRGTSDGEPSITYSGTMSWQNPSNYPDLVDAADWMTLFNERDRHNVDNSNVVPKLLLSLRLQL